MSRSDEASVYEQRNAAAQRVLSKKAFWKFF
jgi:hypothetical protein